MFAGTLLMHITEGLTPYEVTVAAINEEYTGPFQRIIFFTEEGG